MVEQVFSAKELSAAFGCHVHSTTKRRDGLAERVKILIAAAGPALAPSGRVQCMRTAVIQLVATLGKLQAFDPERTADWLKHVCDDVAAP